MLKDYTITVIQEEKTPLAAMPTQPDAGIVLLLILVVILLLGIAICLFMMLKYHHQLVVRLGGIQKKEEQYPTISCFRLQDMEQELEQKLLDKRVNHFDF